VDDRRIVMLHGASAPPTAGWRDYLQQIRDKDVTTLGLLVFTHGGAPGPAQRHELNEVLDGRYFARAIVHESALVRGVVAAVSWFAPGVQAFSPDSWPSAALHAGFRPGELPGVVRSVRRLHAGMTDGVPWLEAVLHRPSIAPGAGSLKPPHGIP
jgi:hypothetical protein